MKIVYCSFLIVILLVWSSYCEARERLEIIDNGEVVLSNFVSGTVEAHNKIEHNQYDSTRVSTRKDIRGYLYLDGDGATPLNYTEVLRLDSNGIVYCTITLWHMPYKEKESRIAITRTIINNSDTEYEYPDWSGLKVEWNLLRKVKK